MWDLNPNNGNANPFCTGGLADGLRHRPCEYKEPREKRVRQVEYVFDLRLWDHKTVPGPDRADVEKRQELIVLSQDLRRDPRFTIRVKIEGITAP